jgi:hypothetical protein
MRACVRACVHESKEVEFHCFGVFENTYGVLFECGGIVACVHARSRRGSIHFSIDCKRNKASENKARVQVRVRRHASAARV